MAPHQEKRRFVGSPVLGLSVSKQNHLIHASFCLQCGAQSNAMDGAGVSLHDGGRARHLKCPLGVYTEATSGPVLCGMHFRGHMNRVSTLSTTGRSSDGK